MKTEQVVTDFRKIKEEYAFNPDIMNEDDERVSRVKQIIDTKLSLADKTIILLYADCQSYRKLGARLGVSHMTLRRECMRIKKIILDEYIKMERIWKDIPGYEGFYMVSSDGLVRSVDRDVNKTSFGKEIIVPMKGRLLSQTKTNAGYMQVHLFKDGKQKNMQVHRLVAMAFIPNPQNLPQINHRDEDRLNNRMENLEWCTAQYNGSYGSRPDKYKTRVSKQDADGTVVATFNSVKEAADSVGCHYTQISHAITDKTAVKGWYFSRV